MQKTTFTPKTQVSIHILAEQEVECIMVDGKIFVEYPMPFPSTGGSNPLPSTEKPSPKKTTKVVEDEDDEEVAKPSKASAKLHTEKELMKMDNADLKELCDDLGIKYAKIDGKNTNRKLCDLILAQQEDAEEAPAPKGKKVVADDEDEKPKKKSAKVDPLAPITEIVEELDATTIEDVEAIKKLTALCPTAKKEIKKIIDAFMDDQEKTIDEVVTELAEVMDLEPADEVVEKPKAKPTKAAPKEELVDAEDLEKGDEVSVYWKDNDEWYEGVVQSNKKGVVIIKYDDGDVLEIDAEEHTKIKMQ